MDQLELMIIPLPNSKMDQEDIDKQTLNLLSEIREIDGLISVRRLRTSISSNQMKGSGFDAGVILILALTQSGPVWDLIKVLASWLTRDRSRSIELKLGESNLRLTGISGNEQQELVEWFQTQAGIRLEKK